MFSHLERRYSIEYIEQVGHNEVYPINDNWSHLVQEVIDGVEAKSLQSVIGLGHSLGGVLITLACIKRPDLFRAIILLDSPLYGRLKSRLVYIAKLLKLIDTVTPARRTRFRRQHWPDEQSLYSYLVNKPLFDAFDEKCLWDYIHHGTMRDRSGLFLKFDRQKEYQIYRTIPHFLPRFHKRLTRPAALLYGTHSDVVRPIDIRNMRKNYSIITHMVQGSHLFPFQHPKQTAQKILMTISQLTD